MWRNEGVGHVLVSKEEWHGHDYDYEHAKKDETEHESEDEHGHAHDLAPVPQGRDGLDEVEEECRVEERNLIVGQHYVGQVVEKMMRRVSHAVVVSVFRSFRHHPSMPLPPSSSLSMPASLLDPASSWMDSWVCAHAGHSAHWSSCDHR